MTDEIDTLILPPPITTNKHRYEVSYISAPENVAQSKQSAPTLQAAQTLVTNHLNALPPDVGRTVIVRDNANNRCLVEYWVATGSVWYSVLPIFEPEDT